MRTSRLAFPRMARIAAIFALPAACAPASDAPTADAPRLFESVQPELFATGGALTNAWADYDADGDPDLFVGFNGGGNRLYRNDGGTFTEVAAEVGHRRHAADACRRLERHRRRW